MKPGILQALLMPFLLVGRWGRRQATSRACSPCLQFRPWCTKALILTCKGPTAWPVSSVAAQRRGLYLGAVEALRCSPQPPSSSPFPFRHYFHVKALPRHTKPVEMHQRHPPRLPLCVLMVRPGGGGWGLEQVCGAVVPSTCSGRSCRPAACQAPLIQGVSHVHCPPRRPLSPPAWCPFHTPGAPERCGWARVGGWRPAGPPASAHRPPPIPSSRPLCPGSCLITRNIKITFDERRRREGTRSGPLSSPVSRQSVQQPP